MPPSQYRNFDTALAEQNAVPLVFMLAGERFVVPLPLAIGPVLTWLNGPQTLGLQYAQSCQDFLRAVIQPTDDELAEQAQAVVDLEAELVAAREREAEQGTLDMLVGTIEAVRSGPGTGRIVKAIAASHMLLADLDDLCSFVIRGGTGVPLDEPESSADEPSPNGTGSSTSFSDGESASLRSAPDSP